MEMKTMNKELKACSLDTARKWVEQEIHDYCTDGMLIGPEIEAVAALTCIRDELNRRAATENKPLTLEQLRKMDGEPVFSSQCGYGIVGSKKVGECAKKLVVGFAYGWEWLDDVMRIGPLYARKPEGSETGG